MKEEVSHSLSLSLSLYVNNNLRAPKQSWKFMMRIKSVDRKQLRADGRSEKDPSCTVFKAEILHEDFKHIWLIENSIIYDKMFSYLI